MNVIEGRFDRRANHRIFSEPVALDITMDVDALAQEGLRFLEAALWCVRDPDGLRGIRFALARLTAIREITHAAAELIEDSVKVEPYEAVEYAGMEATAA